MLVLRCPLLTEKHGKPIFVAGFSASGINYSDRITKAKTFSNKSELHESPLYRNPLYIFEAVTITTDEGNTNVKS